MPSLHQALVDRHRVVRPTGQALLADDCPQEEGGERPHLKTSLIIIQSGGEKIISLSPGFSLNIQTH